MIEADLLKQVSPALLSLPSELLLPRVCILVYRTRCPTGGHQMSQRVGLYSQLKTIGQSYRFPIPLQSYLEQKSKVLVLSLEARVHFEPISDLSIVIYERDLNLRYGVYKKIKLNVSSGLPNSLDSPVCGIDKSCNVMRVILFGIIDTYDSDAPITVRRQHVGINDGAKTNCTDRADDNITNS